MQWLMLVGGVIPLAPFTGTGHEQLVADHLDQAGRGISEALPPSLPRPACLCPSTALISACTSNPLHTPSSASRGRNRRAQSGPVALNDPGRSADSPSSIVTVTSYVPVARVAATVHWSVVGELLDKPVHSASPTVALAAALSRPADPVIVTVTAVRRG